MIHSNICNFYCVSKGVSAEQDPFPPTWKIILKIFNKTIFGMDKGNKGAKIYYCYEKLASFKKSFNCKHRKIKGA